MPHWIDIGQPDDFPTDGHVCLTAGERAVVVCNVAGDLHVIANSCPHAGLPIGDGDLRGPVITCPYHGYTYNVKNGRNIDWPEDELPVRTFPVRIENGRVEIDLGDPK